ncbi:MAG: hypothetical protein SH850_07965 [Planctomycetaceae bacterium]|nr:hypothetical protein [Planctomycetaceae bacterium]
MTGNWSRELRALCLSGLVDVQATSRVETTSSSFPEVVTFVFVQTGFLTEEAERAQHLPAEWFGADGKPLVKANERLVSLDAVKLTGRGAALAKKILRGKADPQVDLVDFVQGVSDGDAERMNIAKQSAACEVLNVSIERPAAEPAKLGKPIAVPFRSNAAFAADAQDQFIDRLAAGVAKAAAEQPAAVLPPVEEWPIACSPSAEAEVVTVTVSQVAEIVKLAASTVGKWAKDWGKPVRGRPTPGGRASVLYRWENVRAYLCKRDATATIPLTPPPVRPRKRVAKVK